jgi:two-component system response regulator
MANETPEILLVEDSPDDVAFFVRTLDKAGLGARLHTVKDGAEALEFIFDAGDNAARLHALRLKVIILDLKLPKVSGLEVLRRLKADPQTRKIPVVILSSSQEERDLIESYQLGVNSYVVKPMDFDAFGTSVRALCQYWLQFNQTA